PNRNQEAETRNPELFLRRNRFWVSLYQDSIDPGHSQFVLERQVDFVRAHVQHQRNRLHYVGRTAGECKLQLKLIRGRTAAELYLKRQNTTGKLEVALELQVVVELVVFFRDFCSEDQCTLICPLIGRVDLQVQLHRRAIFQR